MKRSHVILVGLALLMGAGTIGGGAAFMVLRHNSQASAAEHQAAGAEAAAAETADPVIVSLNRFVTDLADRDRPRYLDVTIMLALKSEKHKARVEKAIPEIRDVALGHLRSLTAARVAGTEGKQQLAESLLKLLDASLGIKKVLITDMLVQ